MRLIFVNRFVLAISVDSGLARGSNSDRGVGLSTEFQAREEGDLV